MKILIATALYPPDIAEQAVYVKELASRLSEKHRVTILTYGYIPEKISGVDIVTIDKRQPLPIRLFRFFVVLHSIKKKNDVLYVENGASVELPTLLATLFSRKPIVFHIGDKGAHQRTKTHTLMRSLERFAQKKANVVYSSIPKNKPEIQPFDNTYDVQKTAYESAWQKHIKELEDIFTHVRK